MRRTNGLRLAIFDCDGTLVDSLGSIVATVTLAWQALDMAPPDPAEVRRFVGLPLDDAIARLAPGTDEAVLRKLRNAYREVFLSETVHHNPEGALYPGLRDAIERLAGEGWLLGIATGKGRRGLDLTLERHGLTDRFATLQTADVAPGKPDPGMVLRAMAETGAEPDATVMIGDTSFDMSMARNAKVAAIGVSWGYHGADELRAAGADVVIDDAELLPPAAHKLTGD